MTSATWSFVGARKSYLGMNFEGKAHKQECLSIFDVVLFTIFDHILSVGSGFIIGKEVPCFHLEKNIY